MYLEQIIRGVYWQPLPVSISFGDLMYLEPGDRWFGSSRQLFVSISFGDLMYLELTAIASWIKHRLFQSPLEI